MCGKLEKTIIYYPNPGHLRKYMDILDGLKAINIIKRLILLKIWTSYQKNLFDVISVNYSNRYDSHSDDNKVVSL